MFPGSEGQPFDITKASVGLDNGVSKLLDQKGIDLKRLRGKKTGFTVNLRFNDIEAGRLPIKLKEFFAERYSPRRVGVENISIRYSYEHRQLDQGGYKTDRKGLLALFPTRDILVEVAHYVGTEEEQILAERVLVVMPDDEVFGLPVIHSVHEAEAKRNFRGVIIPESGIVIYNHTHLSVDKQPFEWDQTTSPIEEWLKVSDRLEDYRPGFPRYDRVTGQLDPAVIAAIAGIIPQLEGDSAYEMTEYGKDYIRQPKRQILIG